jgi:hypothetical protein
VITAACALGLLDVSAVGCAAAAPPPIRSDLALPATHDLSVGVPLYGLCGPDVDDCAAGALCTKESASYGVCRPLCSSDLDCTQLAVPDQPQNRARCVITFASSSSKACTIACNPVTGATGCPGPLGCELFATPDLPEVTDCTVLGSGVDGFDCSPKGSTDCASGYTCVTAGVRRCRKVCRAGVPGDCAAGLSCLVPTGAMQFGTCCPATGC